MKVTSKEELRKIIEESAVDADLNYLDVSGITDMSYLFTSSNFNGDISEWDVSKVRDMSGMFYGSQFSGDISKWNVSNVTNMSRMFEDSQFTGDISKWKLSTDTDIYGMSGVSLKKSTDIDSKFNQVVKEVKGNITLEKLLAETEKASAQLLATIVQFTETIKVVHAGYAEHYAKAAEQTKRIEALLDNYEKRSIGDFIDNDVTLMAKDTDNPPAAKE